MTIAAGQRILYVCAGLASDEYRSCKLQMLAIARSYETTVNLVTRIQCDFCIWVLHQDGKSITFLDTQMQHKSTCK